MLHVLFTSFLSIFTLFILTKLMGNRTIAQLSMFDYINGITIGSIASELATSVKEDYKKPLLAMIIYSVTSIMIAVLTDKSIFLRRVLTGKPIILLDDGKFYRESMKKARIDINEFLTQCRNNGYFDVSKIQTAILETNGSISFIPVSSEKTVTLSDMGISKVQEKVTANIIIDGLLLKDNLKYIGKDINWLNSKLMEYNINDYKNVFLATCDFYGNINFYQKLNSKSDLKVLE